MMTSRYRANKEKYCSVKCAAVGNREAMSKTWFTNGHKPWHKGKTGVYSDKTLALMSKAKVGTIPGNYKGEDVSYAALHHWVTRKLGRPLKCEHCSTNDRVLHWANVSGEYLRQLDDYMGLCVPCHSRYDKGKNSIKEKYENI